MPVPHPRRAVIGGVATATAAALALAMAAAPPAQATPDASATVLVNEVYGGGGNGGASYTNDFIELVNTGTTDVDLSTWAVQYASATGTSWQKTNLTGTIAAGGYYLVQEAAGSTPTTALPTPNATGSIAMSGTAGKVALTNNQTALTGSGATGASIVDFVGYGSTANGYAGSGPAPAQTSALSDQRKNNPVVNTPDNSADFFAAAPTPKAVNPSNTGGVDCGANPAAPECTPGTTTIQDIQGSTFVSPLNGQTVSKVEGVVTAKKSNGFWMQMATPDTSKPANSSGVFVFTGIASPSVGDDVLVSAKVQDYYPLASGETLSTTASLSITELSNVTAVTTRSSGNTVPAPLAITPTTVPAQALATPPDGSTNIEDIPALDPTRSAQEFWEAHEGMLVSITNARVVGPGKTAYGEIYVTTKPGESANPTGGTTITGYDGVPAGRLLVSPISGSVPPANTGDVLTGTTSGPVDWSTFGGYDIAATVIGSRQDNDLQPNDAPAQTAGQLSVATYNVENLAPSDPDSKYQRLAQGVVTNLASPDIISVEEIQDNSGGTDNGIVAADQTIAKLTAAITAANGPAYQSASIDPVDDQDGGQPGGNIRVVFLYNPARVDFTPQAVANPSTTAVTVSTAGDGTATLSANPGRVDPTNTAWNSSRKPLAGEFVFQGKKVIVVGNHFNSKGGDQNSDGRFQPPTRSSEVQRTQQANVLKTFVNQVKAADPNANIVLAGDFNDYQFSGPITTLTDNGTGLVDLINTLPPVERYTYNFNGISQVLDHIFISPNLASKTSYTVVHSNAEFADQASDHDPQVARIQLTPETPATKNITLLNINDFHGRIDSNTVKFAGTIEQQRAAAGDANTVFLSAGDNIGASLFASASQQDNPTIDVLNALDLQASAVGNHEFDQGYDDLTGHVAGRADWDYLGANVYYKGTTNPALPEYKVITVDGIRLGVIGAVTQETPSLVSPAGISNLDFGNPVEAVNRVAAQLTDGDESNGEADVLVAEYHAGAVDSESSTVDLATELANGGEFADIVNNTSAKVAAIWTGHTHKTYTFDAPVPGESGKTRPIVQTGEYGNNIGNITLTVNTSDDSIASYTMALVPRTTTADSDLVAQYPRVAQVKQIVDAALAQAAQIGNTPIGSISQDITRAFSGSAENRGAESTLGNVVANALRDELSSSDLGGADIGVVNPGGLRSDLTYASAGTPNDANGVVTYAEANAVLPFVNNLWTLSLTGAQFKQVLEQQWQPTGSARPFLNLGLSSNVGVTYNPSAPAGSHITSVTVNGNALDPNGTYRIGTFSFLATGGDNFTAFTGASNVKDTGLVDRDAWIDYLKNHQNLTPSFAKRQVAVTNQPSTVSGGTSVTFGVANLDLTSKSVPTNTSVTAYLSGQNLGTFPVSGGAATVTVTIPRNISGASTLQLIADPTNTPVRIPLTITAPGTLKLAGGTTYAAGDTVTASLNGWAANDRVTVSFNGAVQGTAKIGALGNGKVTFSLPVTYAPGTYPIQATSTISGANTAPVNVKVVAKPFQAGAMSADKTVVEKPGNVKLTLTNWVPGTVATITLDGTTALKTVTTDATGKAVTSVNIRGNISAGTHRIVATAPDGSSVSVNISVITG